MEEENLAASKKNLGLRGTIVFIDESGFSEGPVIRRTWAPRGITPVLRAKCRSWKRASAIGALGYRVDRPRARVFLKLHDKEIRSEQVLRFLQHLRRHIRGKVLVLWDGLAAHRSILVRDWVERQSWLQVERLPAYAPELNPVEGLWSWSKGKSLANVCSTTLDPVLDRVRGGIRKIRRRQNTLRGFLHKAGLSLWPDHH